jgi:hypothetical protein
VQIALVLDDDLGLAPLAGVLLADGLAELDVDELDGAGLLGEDRGAVRVPLDDRLALLHLIAGLA